MVDFSKKITVSGDCEQHNENVPITNLDVKAMLLIANLEKEAMLPITNFNIKAMLPITKIDRKGYITYLPLCPQTPKLKLTLSLAKNCRYRT